jgi:hypothetical protein
MRTTKNPVTRNVCPASRPKTPPSKSVVIAAVAASEMPMSAKKMPYHRRSGANQRAPVTVISGVIDTATKKQISPPVPSTSASVLVRTSLAFSDSQPRMMKTHGTNAGRRRKNRAIARLLNRGKCLDRWSIQASADCLLTGWYSESSPGYPGARVSPGRGSSEPGSGG